MKLVNLGCGDRFHSDWINVDLIPNSKDVLQVDVVRGLPFPNESIDAVYASHVLEHLTKEEGLRLVSEAFRVLKRGGVLRVVVPDLETIINEYRKWLRLAKRGDSYAATNYEWIMIELIDQCTRTRSGGYMKQYLRRKEISNSNYVKGRIGYMYELIHNIKSGTSPSFVNYFKSKLLQIGLINRINKTFHDKLDCLYIVKLFKAGKLELSGEKHRWMYDSYSISSLLNSCGFRNCKMMRPEKSRIKKWGKYKLDVDSLGFVRKPDSLFAEAIK